MIRWAIVISRGVVGDITLYDSYTEAVTEAKAVYEAMVEKPDAFRVVLLSQQGGDMKEVYTGYDAIKGKEYLCFRDLLEASKLNQSQFGRAYGIPLRTVQNWCAGDEPQIYMLSLLAVAVFSNKEVANELRI